MEVLDQVPPQDTSRVRIQPLESANHELIQPTRVREISRSGIHDVVVELPVGVSTREPRVSSDNLLDAFGTRGVARPVEVGWESHVPEEGGGGFHGELALGLTSVDEEVDGEDRLSVCSEISNVLEGELRVGGDGILNTGETELSGDGEVVEASTILVAEFDKLKCYTIG